MKEKLLIFQSDPCSTRLDDPTIQTLADRRLREPTPCSYYSDRGRCSRLRQGCIQVAGHKAARYVLQLYSEATEQTLAMEIDEFRRRAPMPPKDLEGYIDTPEYHYRLVTEPELVVKRVADFARKVLDLKPGERVPRSPEEMLYLKVA